MTETERRSSVLLPQKVSKRVVRPVKFDPLRALIITAFAWAIVPNVIQYHLGFKPSAQLSEEFTLTTAASLAKSALQYAVFALSGVTLLHTLANRTHYKAWLLIYLAPWLALSTASLLSTQIFTVSSLVFVAFGVGIAGHKDKMSLLRMLGKLTVTLAVVSLAMVATTPNALMSQANVADAKAIIGMSLLNGPLPHPNTLGQTLALGLPFVFMIEKRWLRNLGVVSVLFALVWASSRTSLLAVGVALAVGVGWLAARKLRRYEKLIPGMPLLAVYGFIIPISLVFVAVAGPRSFSNRGLIWDTSLSLWEQRPVWGWGSDLYATLAGSMRNIGVLAFHGHSMFVNALVVGGLVGAVALGLLYAALLQKSWVQGSREQNIAVAMFAVVFVVIGWFEVPTTFYTLGATSWVAWAAVGLVLALPRTVSNPREPGQVAGILDPGRA